VIVVDHKKYKMKLQFKFQKEPSCRAGQAILISPGEKGCRQIVNS
jgi:hypothetical protein